MKAPTLPVIHLNGTSPEDLMEDNLAVRSAIQSALDAMAKQEFIGRDYYPVEGSFQKALEERKQIAQQLREMTDYFLTIAEHCSKAIADREERKARR